ncbi:DNA polymerase II, partial [Candidatus Woesearchaeota archaeon]|nr:DNA polymerase II [Candidatus Woesearchaeota archaeon]
SMYSDGLKEMLAVSKEPIDMDGVLAFPNEKLLLEAFSRRVQEFDPDVITGWNFIDFDLKILRELFQKHRIPFNLGRNNSEGKLRIQSAFFRESDADLPGRAVLDGLHLIRSSFIRLQDYRLETAASKLLGESKSVAFANKGQEIDDMYKLDIKSLLRYNLKDAELVYRILYEKNLLDLAIELSMLTGMQLERVNASIASLDFLYISETRKLGKAVPCVNRNSTDERIKGGFVRDSTPGIYDYVSVLDFKSLYPSIMRTFNIDPLAFSPDGEIEAPNGARFRREKGILPRLIQELWEEREKAKKAKDSVKSFAVKTIMNSFFGVLASPNCRFFSLEMGNAITHFGQFFIKLAASKIEEQGYPVIYGDTDSVFVDTKAKSLEEARKTSQEIPVLLNKFYASYIQEKYGLKSYLELEYEKTFVRFLMPRIRGGEKGSKKRYAGMIKVDGKEKFEFVGLESVRRDWTDAAKEFQQKLLDLVFHKTDAGDFVRTFVADMKAGKYDDKLIYRKELQKPLHEYTKTTPPHVKAARQLKELDSTIISYVMTTAGPEPEQKRKHSLDYDHYIEKQLKPIADTILSFYDISFDDIVAGSTQKTLFSY